MLTPAAKRRRRAAEVATATLTRPFRSPVIRRDGRAATEAASPERLHKRRQDDSARSPTKDTAAASAPQDRLKAATEDQAPKGTPSPSSLAELVQDFLVDLDAGDRSLAAAAKAAEAQPSPTAHKTAATASNDDDDELPALIARWREAARMAADEVFSQVAERVAHAGGVKAWRAMMRGDGWGADRAGGRGDGARRREHADDDEDERSDDDRDDRDPEQDDDRDDEEQEEEEEHAEFTMSMMLKSLRVEPGLLGYNEAEERWED